MAALTPEQLAKSGSEHAHQSALFCWAALPEVQVLWPMLKLMFAVPNGGERGDTKKSAMIRRAQLKAEGVKPGVPDIFLPYPMSGWHGLFIEMKVKPNKLTDEQLEFGNAAIKVGYCCGVCYSWEDAVTMIVSYLRGEFNAMLDPSEWNGTNIIEREVVYRKLSKLSTEAIAEIVKLTYPDAMPVKTEHHVFGGSIRTEYFILSSVSPNVLYSVVASSIDSAWKSALQRIIRNVWETTE